MTTQLAETTFLGWRADAWAAAGVWTTIAVYAFVGFVAYRQPKEARELRAEQTRPFVIVDVAFRSILIELSIKNIGPTAAKDVRITFDEPLTATSHDPDWQNSTAFSQGIPPMAPDRQMRFLTGSLSPGDATHRMELGVRRRRHQARTGGCQPRCQ